MSAQLATYDSDVIAWAQEQAKLLRAGKFDQLDIEHIADEVEDVGKSEQRELSSRMAVLIAHLLKWQYQPERREVGASWKITINDQRIRIALAIKKTPSLKSTLRDRDWQQEMWLDARSQARAETNLDTFPDVCHWSTEQVLSPAFFPES